MLCNRYDNIGNNMSFMYIIATFVETITYSHNMRISLYLYQYCKAYIYTFQHFNPLFLLIRVTVQRYNNFTIMKQHFFTALSFLTFCLPIALFSQTEALTYAEASAKTTNRPAVTAGDSEAEVKAVNQVITRFFEAMENGNVEALKGTCTATVLFQTHAQDQHGRHQIFDERIEDMVNFVASSTSGGGFKMNVEFEMAQSESSVSVFRSPYYFYINGELSHCGVNSFEMVKTEEGWKIKKVIDTRFRSCK